MTRFLVLVSFLIVCLFANFSGQTLAASTGDNLSLDNFKLANSKPYDALAKAFQKTRQSSVTNSGGVTEKKSLSKIGKTSKSTKKSNISKNKKSYKPSTKKSKDFKKSASRR